MNEYHVKGYKTEVVNVFITASSIIDVLTKAFFIKHRHMWDSLFIGPDDRLYTEEEVFHGSYEVLPIEETPELRADFKALERVINLL